MRLSYILLPSATKQLRLLDSNLGVRAGRMPREAYESTSDGSSVTVPIVLDFHERKNVLYNKRAGGKSCDWMHKCIFQYQRAQN